MVNLLLTKVQSCQQLFFCTAACTKIKAQKREWNLHCVKSIELKKQLKTSKASGVSMEIFLISLLVSQIASKIASCLLQISFIFLPTSSSRMLS